MIPTLANRRKSLDDFCALFHGQNDNGTVWVKPFDAGEVYRTRTIVAPYDSKGFFTTRLTSRSVDIPTGGIDGGGFRLVYTEMPNMSTDPLVHHGLHELEFGLELLLGGLERRRRDGRTARSATRRHPHHASR